jgi:hypothetical protein
MTDVRSDETVHQAYFGWSHDGRGLTVLGYSFSNEADAEQWLQRLKTHIRLQPVRGTDPPSHALSYLEFKDGNVAVLRRIASGYSEGRNDSHALIGPADVLDVPLALGLGEWNGWEDRPPSKRFIQTVPVRQLPSPTSTTQRLRPLVERFEDELRAVLTRLLDDPGELLSVIGCADENRLAMVWALRETADRYVRERFGVNRRWSFSTYEHRHDNTVVGLPEIVFLPAKQEGAPQVDRATVDLTRPPATSRNLDLAAQLVDQFLRGTLLPAPEPERAPATVPAGAPHHDTLAPHPVTGHSPTSAMNDRPQRPDLHGNNVPSGHGQHDQGTAHTDKHVAAGLLQARTVRDFQAELDRLLARNWQDRERLRKELDARDMNTITRLVEINLRHELFGGILEAMYGPKCTDLRDPAAMDHAVKLVKHSHSEQLAMMLGAAAEPINRPRIVDAAFQRWTMGGVSPDVVPAGWLARTLRRARMSRWMPVAAAAAIAALVAFAFVLGLQLSSPQPSTPASGNGAATPGTTTSPAKPGSAGPAGTVANAPDPRPGVVTVPPAQNQQYYAFVRLGASYYPQSVCTTADYAAWHCTRRADPPPKQGTTPVLVAVSVPSEQVADLDARAGENKAVERRQEWGQDVPVP